MYVCTCTTRAAVSSCSTKRLNVIILHVAIGEACISAYVYIQAQLKG